MVAAPSKLELRTVGPDSFEEIYPLLALFENRKMSRDDWRRMLFTYTWWDGNERGFAIYADGVAVGFLGTIFSKRHIHGRSEVVCNTSSWIVRAGYRHASIMLLKPILALRDCTIVNLTPTARSYEIFHKLGFVVLESEQLLLPPLASPRSLLGGTFTSDPSEFVDALSEAERTIRRDLAGSPRARQVFLRRGGAGCYLVATRRPVKGVPLAELQYVGDANFLWENRALVHLALLRTMGAVGLAVDARFAHGRTFRVALRRPAKRLYRPSRSDIPPEALDGLFSEMMTLQV